MACNHFGQETLRADFTDSSNADVTVIAAAADEDYVLHRLYLSCDVDTNVTIKAGSTAIFTVYGAAKQLYPIELDKTGIILGKNTALVLTKDTASKAISGTAFYRKRN